MPPILQMYGTGTFSSIKIFLRKTSKNEQFVYMRVHVNRKQLSISTKVPVFEQDWDHKTLTILKTDPEASDKNMIIRKSVTRLNDIFIRCRLQGKSPTYEQILKEYSREPITASFLTFVQEEIAIRQATKAVATHKAHLSLLKKLTDFRPKIYFDDINEDFISGFQKYMKVSLDNGKNTIQKTSISAL